MLRKLEASVPVDDVIVTPGSLDIVVRVTKYINIIKHLIQQSTFLLKLFLRLTIPENYLAHKVNCFIDVSSELRNYLF